MSANKKLLEIVYVNWRRKPTAEGVRSGNYLWSWCWKAERVEKVEEEDETTVQREVSNLVPIAVLSNKEQNIKNTWKIKTTNTIKLPQNSI